MTTEFISMCFIGYKKHYLERILWIPINYSVYIPMSKVFLEGDPSTNNTMHTLHGITKRVAKFCFYLPLPIFHINISHANNVGLAVGWGLGLSPFNACHLPGRHPKIATVWANQFSKMGVWIGCFGWLSTRRVRVLPWESLCLLNGLF